MIPLDNESLSPFYSPRMTFGEIHETLNTCSAVMLPLGSHEPCAEYGAMGVSALSCFSIANTLSKIKKIILSPLLPYGYSIAFRAFDGCCALSEKTLRMVIADLVKSWAAHGVKSVIILDGVYENYHTTCSAVHWIQSRNPTIKLCLLNWQHSVEVRSFIAQSCSGKEYGRSEYGILSMAAYLDQTFVRFNDHEKGPVTVDEKTYRKWEKTGRDPEKFKKLFPYAETSTVSRNFNAEFGKMLFQYICDVFENKIKHELNI
jgi:creatinine amidohydrolase/Fe(II)-dependent formamide hydrolase-like protein